MADFERLTESELRDALADVECMISGEWHKIDVDVAVAEYFFRPERFHTTSHDNPEGDPVRELVLTDGPWWVPEVSRFDGWALPGDHGPPLDFFPLGSDEGAAIPLPAEVTA